MSKQNVLLEARRLYKLGFAIHWLHPKSKRPIENGWTTGPRKTWKELQGTYEPGYNVGVRTGEASQIGENYLACIDVDIKEPSARKEALTKLKELIGEAICPEVRSGSGNGSRHLYCITKKPFKMITVAKEKTWEICIYSDGRQMVISPSIHPSGRAYEWKVPVDDTSNFPLLSFTKLLTSNSETKSNRIISTKKEAAERSEDFAIDEGLDIRWMPEVTDKIRALIEKGIWRGKVIEDRSAYLLVAATSLVSAGLDINQVLTVLTDQTTFLGKCAYDHAKTNVRKRAALWLHNYTVKRVLKERDARSVFKKASEYEPEVGLDEETAAKQGREVKAQRNWLQELKRTGKDGDGPPASTFRNVELILCNDVNPLVAKRDIFAYRDVYGCATPWGGVEGELIGDDDIAKIKFWLSNHWRMEVSKEILYDSLTVISCRNSFDPVKDWLESLEQWDGKKRLDTWLSKNFEAEGEPEYLAQVFRKWVVAMVMRQYNPGAKFDWMPIFDGAQGVGKSSFGRLLVGDKHFLDWLPNLADKDSALALQGIWGVEMGELATMRRNEIEVIKGYVTRTVDKVRPPFGRKPIESPRRCVFYGTTNRDTYLRDETGNRRFKPIMVGALNFHQLEEDRAQLFAEAKYLYENFIETEMTMELEGKARIYEAKIHAEKMVQDDAFVMMEIIEDYFLKQRKTGEIIDPKKFLINELFTGQGPLPRWTQNARNHQFAAKALKMLGADKWKSHGQRVWKLAKGPLGAGLGLPHHAPQEMEDF